MSRRRAALLLLQIAAASFTVPALTAASLASAKKPIAFSGRVESVDRKMRTVAVVHGNIAGFLPAMTSDHPVDRSDWLDRLSEGDEIAATVYTGDPRLYNVQILRRKAR